MDWMQLIGSYAFPIVACVAMAWYVKYVTDKNREDMLNMNHQHKEEMQKVSDALNNNTLAIHDLTTLIKTMKEDK